MKVHLMFPDRDCTIRTKFSVLEEVLESDLGIQRIVEEMAQKDEIIASAARSALLGSLDDWELIHFRQHIVEDTLAHPQVVRNLYSLANEALAKKREQYMSVFMRYPSAIVHTSAKALQMYLEMLNQLVSIARTEINGFSSDGFINLFSTIIENLDEHYLLEYEQRLKDVTFRGGVCTSARLGKANKACEVVLRKKMVEPNILKRIFAKKFREYSFHIAPRDESGARALSDLKDLSLAIAAKSVQEATEHITSFFQNLKQELAFYVGCINLAESLKILRCPICLPKLEVEGFAFEALREMHLVLDHKTKVIPNNTSAIGKKLVVITGANQGGKTIFLKSLGIAQLMMQSGMFVPATSYSSQVFKTISSHFRRGEDHELTKGKFEEEIQRMSNLVENLKPGSLLLCNESFSSTNEIEGSSIALETTRALVDSNLMVVYVTHLETFAQNLASMHSPQYLFLSAERDASGNRTFRIQEGIPQAHAFGEDVYAQVFGSNA